MVVQRTYTFCGDWPRHLPDTDFTNPKVRTQVQVFARQGNCRPLSMPTLTALARDFPPRTPLQTYWIQPIIAHPEYENTRPWDLPPDASQKAVALLSMSSSDGRHDDVTPPPYRYSCQGQPWEASRSYGNAAATTFPYESSDEPLNLTLTSPAYSAHQVPPKKRRTWFDGSIAPVKSEPEGDDVGPLNLTCNRRLKEEDQRPETFRTHTETSRPHTETFRTHTETFRSHTETFRPHTETFRTHTETFRSRTETFRPHTETFRPHTETFPTHIETFHPHTDTQRHASCDTNNNLSTRELTSSVNPDQTQPPRSRSLDSETLVNDFPFSLGEAIRRGGNEAAGYGADEAAAFQPSKTTVVGQSTQQCTVPPALPAQSQAQAASLNPGENVNTDCTPHVSGISYHGSDVSCHNSDASYHNSDVSYHDDYTSYHGSDLEAWTSSVAGGFPDLVTPLRPGGSPTHDPSLPPLVPLPVSPHSEPHDNSVVAVEVSKPVLKPSKGGVKGGARARKIKRRNQKGTEDGESGSEDKEDCVLLWEFLYDMLKDETKRNMVRWENETTLTFRIVNPNMLANQWGDVKGRGNMTYEKMSRALRYYYGQKIMEKVASRRLIYRYTTHPTKIIRGIRGAKPGVPHKKRKQTVPAEPAQPAEARPRKSASRKPFAAATKQQSRDRKPPMVDGRTDPAVESGS